MMDDVPTKTVEFDQRPPEQKVTNFISVTRTTMYKTSYENGQDVYSFLFPTREGTKTFSISYDNSQKAIIPPDGKELEERKKVSGLEENLLIPFSELLISEGGDYDSPKFNTIKEAIDQTPSH